MTHRRLLLFLGLLVAAVVAACQASDRETELPKKKKADDFTPKADVKYRSVYLPDIPHVRQRPDFCGEACAAMYLKKLGYPVGQDYVYNRSGLDPVHGRGCYTRELAASLQRMGFRIGSIWFTARKSKAADDMEYWFDQLHGDLRRGAPSIVCMHYGEAPRDSEHFRLVVGYDAKSDEVIYHEPAEADGANRRMKRSDFLKLWPLKYEKERWTVIRMPLYQGRMRIDRPGSGYTDADYAQHIRRLKKRLPSDDFHIMIQKPFVVVGDGDHDDVRRSAIGTVQWTVDRLKRDYFRRDPLHILNIWLFKDKESYEKHNKLLFDREPSTPYGYYSSYHRALVMNISTGGGTLVHEIVHPFIEANFPDCPSWFNEGLASLYEQSGDNRGRIWGYTNWRLKGLQKAIKKKRVPSFAELCATTTEQFYDEDKGTNYSQARYLCLYLQQRGLLRKYYHTFRANCEHDPGGYETLKTVLGESDMEDFKKRWEKWVMELRYA